VWLKQLGPWSDADIAERLIPCYPEVCTSLQHCLDVCVLPAVLPCTLLWYLNWAGASLVCSMQPKVFEISVVDALQCKTSLSVFCLGL
jgi:hypothetical protein